MKLVDILARELKDWPESFGFYCVAGGGPEVSWGAWFNERMPERRDDGWYDVGCVELWLSKEPSDHLVSVVTRAEWQAAVDALNAPKVVELEIDWSKQPEAFPLWLEGTNKDHRNHSGWYRRVGQIFEGSDGGQWRSVREGQFFTVHRKPDPKVVEWDKGSLPPIGSVVEWDGCTFAPEEPQEKDLRVGDQVTIIAHLKDGDFEMAAFTFNPKIHNPARGSIWVNQGAYGCFRPIRTAEQVAAEEREKAIKDMMEVTSDGISCIGQDDALALYKAGYRKEPKPCGS